jgi:hypothetical protein
MQGFWLVGLFRQKATVIMDLYFHYFSSISSEIIITQNEQLLQSRIVQYN